MGVLGYVVGLVSDALSRARRPPVVLDRAMAERFRREQLQRCSGKYVREQYKRILWWLSVFEGRDIRRVSLERLIIPALDRARGRAARIASLKRLCAWLVFDRHELRADEDPTLGLRCMQGRPEQWRRSKVVPRRVLAAVRARMPRRYRDGLDVLRGTGWHCTELERFAQGGEIGPRPPKALAEVAGVLVTRHKCGKTLRTPVTAATLAAARRVRSRGGICLSRLAKAIAEGARAARVPRWAPGQMRHTVATWAVEAGADPHAVAAFLHHTDPRTTRRFYAVHVAPAKVPTPL